FMSVDRTAVRGTKAAQPTADREEVPNLGKPCGWIFNKDDGCYRGRRIQGVDIGVTVPYDTFREEVLAVIIEWLMDLMLCRLLNDISTLREVVAAEIYLSREKESSSLTSNQEPFTSLLSIIVIDREAGDLNQIPLRPDLHRLERGSIHRLPQQYHLPTFTHHHPLLHERNPEQTHHLPPDSTRRVDIDSYPFRSKRFMPVFSDLRYLCTNRTIQELIAANHDYITQFISICQIFMGIKSNKRAASSHVEYETESWISIFNVMLSLSMVVKVYGEAFALPSSANLLYATTAVLHTILLTCTLSGGQLDRAGHSPIASITIKFGNAEYQAIQFDVLTQWLASPTRSTRSRPSSSSMRTSWAMVHLLKSDEESLGGRAQEREGAGRARGVDFRCEIRAGLWIRNGLAFRGPFVHYGDLTLRDLCYDQDLFILQTAFIILGPKLVMITILTRFYFALWFSGHTPYPKYEGSQLIYMVEEFLYVIIICLNEFANPRHLIPLGNVRRELLYGLALGICSFAERSKNVDERIINNIHLVKDLSSVADHKSPSGTTSCGVYELKDEVFNEVDPFFYHYTRNRREEVEIILKAQITKETREANPIFIPNR
ncbi:hypothetical protein FRB97_008711, partial [Tulasnella sp. 331]